MLQLSASPLARNIEEPMLNKFVFIFSFSLILLGCSRLSTYVKPEAIEISNQWSVEPDDPRVIPLGPKQHEKYLFKKDSTTLTVYTEFIGGRVLLVGPPFVPLLPSPTLFSSTEFLEFSVICDLNTVINDETSDIKSICLILPDSNIIRPSSVFSSQADSSTTIGFHNLSPSIAEYVLRFGKVMINNHNMDIPEIHIKRNSKLSYEPFWGP
jgi:hypothetical protein